MLFVNAVILALALTFSVGDKLDDANNYLDEVLKDHLPSAIKAANLNIYKMPDITRNDQEKTSDGATLNTKIILSAGNLTGLQNMLRDRCEEPFESSGNISVVCHIVFPHLRAEYAGRFQSIKGYNNPFDVHIRQFDFTLEIDNKQVEIELEVTSSPSLQIPSVKRLTFNSRGVITIGFHSEAPNPEDVTEGVEDKFIEYFDVLYFGEFKNALETAVGSVRYPKNE